MTDQNPNTLTHLGYERKAAVNEYDSEVLKGTEVTIFSSYFGKKGYILDIGCGTGRTSIHLQKRGHKVVAIDYSKAMIEQAINRYGNTSIDFRVMDARNLDFKDNTFDYVLFSFNGIDHLYPAIERTKVLKEIYRILKPGGTFAFSSHNSLFIPNNPHRLTRFIKTVLRGKVYPYRWEFFSFGPGIIRCISPQSEKAELKQVGFKDTEIVSKYGKNIWKVTFTDPYPSYVCSKPTS